MKKIEFRIQNSESRKKALLVFRLNSVFGILNYFIGYFYLRESAKIRVQIN